MVDGVEDTFKAAGGALDRSCAIQKNACAEAANSGADAGITVADCDAQRQECSQAAQTAAAGAQDAQADAGAADNENNGGAAAADGATADANADTKAGGQASKDDGKQADANANAGEQQQQADENNNAEGAQNNENANAAGDNAKENNGQEADQAAAECNAAAGQAAGKEEAAAGKASGQENEAAGGAAAEGAAAGAAAGDAAAGAVVLPDGRIAQDAVAEDFNVLASPFKSAVVKGDGLNFSDVITFPDIQPSIFDAAGNTKAFQININDQSIFVPEGQAPQDQFRRADLLPSIASTLNNVSTTGVKTMHFSLQQDPAKPLALTTNEYQLAFLETADFESRIFDVRAGTGTTSPSLTGENIVVLGRSGDAIQEMFVAPFSADLQNFAVTLDFDQK